MDKLLADLAAVFTARSVADLEGEGGRSLLRQLGAGSLEELQAIPGYPRAHRLVSTVRERLDRVAQRPVEEQVSEALALVNEAKARGGRDAADELEVTRLLVEKLLLPGWTAAQQQRYTHGLEILLQWMDYFLSYTRRQASQTNEAFRGLLKEFYTLLPPARARASENFVAKILVWFMKVQGMKGFLDDDDLRIGEVIGDKVVDYCQRSFGFLQLIEDVSFADLAPHENWSFEEYQAFSSAAYPSALAAQAPLRFFFFLTEKDLVEPAALPAIYKPWFADVSKRLRGELAGANREMIRLAVREVAAEIQKFKDAVVKEIIYS
jgi:hypothetical protein